MTLVTELLVNIIEHLLVSILWTIA